MYPWPFGDFDNVMDESLDIAMDYLIRTGQAVKFREAQTTAANAIASAWRAGVRNRVKLTNLATGLWSRKTFYTGRMDSLISIRPYPNDRADLRRPNQAC